jgi:hypothetical protein
MHAAEPDDRHWLRISAQAAFDLRETLAASHECQDVEHNSARDLVDSS